MTTAAIYQPAESHRHIMGLRASAVLEMAIFFAVMVGYDLIFGAGNRLWGVEPHPFWVIILLMAVQYGTSEGVVAAAVASLILLVGNMPEREVTQDAWEYGVQLLRQPLMWLLTAVVLGELRNRHVRERDYLRKELREARQRETIIAESYDKVRVLKEKLELRIASQLRASITTYRAARSIEKTDPAEVLQGAQELVQSILNPSKFSIYTLGTDGLTLTLFSGWDKEEEFNASYTTQSPLYSQIIGRQAVLCGINPEHETILDKQGILAGPLVDRETGEVSGMLKIEDISFLDLNLTTIETFRAICDWVGMAMVNATRYQSAKEGSLVNPDHNMYSFNYFQRYTNYITALGRRVGFPVMMLVIRLVQADQMSPDQRLKAARVLSKAVQDSLRTVDLAFDYQRNGEEFSIVLPATHREGAEIVRKRMEATIRKELPKTLPASFSMSVQVIHE